MSAAAAGTLSTGRRRARVQAAPVKGVRRAMRERSALGLDTALLTAVVLSRGRHLSAALVVGAGFVFGPIFPTILAVLLGHFEPPVHGRAVGIFFAIGGIGWSVVPMLIGAYSRRASVQRGFAIAVAAAAGLSVVAAILLAYVFLNSWVDVSG